MTKSNYIDTTAQSGNTTTPEPGDDRTFSQDDVNRIVGDRLAKEKAKTDAALADRESELVQRELMFEGKEILTEKKLPVELLDILRYTDKKTLEQSITKFEEVLSQMKSNQTFVGMKPGNSGWDGMPTINDADYRAAMGLK